jgi:citrate synthase
MIIHAEHGGGNNSSFATRCVTSSGTDTYAAIAAGIGALKGPRHGGANIKVFKMLEDMKANISDITNEGQVADYITKIMNKEANDHSGLVYGMGHAVYTLSDPRAVILRRYADKFSKICGREDEFRMLNLIESLTPELFAKHRGINKKMCANVDLYSGLVYDMLGIPQDLFTPIFMAARMAGWSAHRIEELTTGGRIIRPAYKNVTIPREYVPMSERVLRTKGVQAEYIPIEER